MLQRPSLSSLLTLSLLLGGPAIGCARLSYELAEPIVDTAAAQNGTENNTGRVSVGTGASSSGSERNAGGDGFGGAAGTSNAAGGSFAGTGFGGNGFGGNELVGSPDAGVSDSPGRCGDGSIDPDEDCDDGGQSTSCDSDCTPALCGDGVLNTLAGEQCDEGGQTATCRSDCTLVNCGNGLVDAVAGEQCDDAGQSASCNNNCTLSSCGDGITNSSAGEACDDGGQSATCNSDCTLSSCGDNVTNSSAGEDCDTAGQSASCNANCSTAVCGDNIVNSAAGETCDTGGQTASCDGDCSAVSCGDGLTNSAAGEACDDGGQSASCDSDCTPALCGDGFTNPAAGETCDTAGESPSCDNDCTAVSCGDNVVNSSAGEECEPAGDPDCQGNCKFAYTAFLANRFSFDESGTSFGDSQGGASGTVVGTSLAGNGNLSLSGGGQHATLSPGIVSSLTNATVEVWVTWTGSNSWERVFDFGTSEPLGPDLVASNYFSMTPKNDNGKVRVALSDGPSNADVVVELGFPLPASKTHVAVVVDDDDDTMRVYVNGALQGSAPLVIGLSVVDDVDNYLGRSQFSYDPYFSGTIHEFRIYDRALTAAQVADSFNAGESL